MARRNKSSVAPPAVQHAPSSDADILVGMKAICAFLRMSDATVLKWLREYDDFPVKKNGGYISSRYKLNLWFQAYLGR